MKSILIACLSVLVFSAFSEDTRFVLKKEFRPAMIYSGKITYSKTAVVSFEEKGRLSYVAPVGTYAENDVYDINGNVVFQGTLLAKQDTVIPENALQLAQVRLKETGVILAEKEQTYLRDKGLYGKKAVSTKQYLESQLYYETALIDRRKAEIELDRCKRVLEASSIRAPFQGVVEEVYQRRGAAVDVAHRVLKFSALSPARIQVALPEDITRQLDQTTQILVYPVDSLTPVAAWFGDSNMQAQSLECFADNPLLPVGELTEEEKKLPLIDDLSIIPSHRISREPLLLWIDPSMLKKDASGSFVWKLKDSIACVAQAPLKRINRLEKIPVTATDLEITGETVRLRGIRKTPALGIHDILAGSVPETVKSGERVAYQTKRHRFLPGETVRVILLPSAKKFTGFYVPLAALREKAEGQYGIRILNPDGSERQEDIATFEKQGSYIRVSSPVLKDGMQLKLEEK